MSTFRGTLRKNPLEGGFYELHSEDGSIYRLEGAVTGREGEQVQVEGSIDAGDGFGIHMTGSPTLKVQSISPLNPAAPGSGSGSDSGANAKAAPDLPGSTSKSSC